MATDAIIDELSRRATGAVSPFEGKAQGFLPHIVDSEANVSLPEISRDDREIGLLIKSMKAEYQTKAIG